MPKDELGLSIMKSASSSEVKDLTIDLAELGVDSMLDEGLLKDVRQTPKYAALRPAN